MLNKLLNAGEGTIFQFLVAIVFTIIAVFSIRIAYAWADSNPEPPVNVTAAELQAAYHNNAVAAHDQYQLRHLRLSGKVQEISWVRRYGLLKVHYVTLIPTHMNADGNVPQETKTHCVINKRSRNRYNRQFPDSQVRTSKELMTPLQRGQLLTVQGDFLNGGPFTRDRYLTHCFPLPAAH